MIRCRRTQVAGAASDLRLPQPTSSGRPLTAHASARGDPRKVRAASTGWHLRTFLLRTHALSLRFRFRTICLPEVQALRVSVPKPRCHAVPTCPPAYCLVTSAAWKCSFLAATVRSGCGSPPHTRRPRVLVHRAIPFWHSPDTGPGAALSLGKPLRRVPDRGAGATTGCRPGENAR